jgi:hypothetical protein
MFIAVRKYRVRRGSTPGWAQRVRDSFVPLMRELAGFRRYYLLDGGPDELNYHQHIRQRRRSAGVEREGR